MKDKGSICHLTTVHLRNDPRIFHRECRSTAEKGFKTFLLVHDDLGDELRYGVHVHSIGRANRTWKRLLWMHPKMLLAAIRINGDIYQIHDPELLIVGLLLKVIGRTVIYDVHENSYWQLLSAFKDQPVKKYWIPKLIDRIERLSARWLTGLVVTNPALESKFEPLNRNTVAVRNFPNEIFLRSRLQNPDGQMLAYIGLISEARGIWQMMDLLELVPNSMIIAGMFISDELKRKVQKHPGWKKVIYHEYVDWNEIPRILSNAGIGLCTLLLTKNHMNTYALKMFEYMALGIPIIVSDFPLWADIVNRHKCGLVVNPENVTEIVKAVEWLSSNKDEAREMGLKGKNAVIAEYNWENEFARLENFYENILS